LHPSRSPLLLFALGAIPLALAGTGALARAAGPEGSSGKAAPAATAPSAPGLDQLLKLPGSVDYGFEKKGGATRSEWRARFLEARSSVDGAQTALAKAQEDLASAAGESDSWQFKPPGIPGQDSADTNDGYRLRQEVRNQRNELERAKARLRELEVQADLSGVPEDWRGPRTEPSTKNESVPPAPRQP